MNIWEWEKSVFIGVWCITETPRHFIGDLSKLHAFVTFFICSVCCRIESEESTVRFLMLYGMTIHLIWGVCLFYHLCLYWLDELAGVLTQYGASSLHICTLSILIHSHRTLQRLIHVIPPECSFSRCYLCLVLLAGPLYIKKTLVCAANTVGAEPAARLVVEMSSIDVTSIRSHESSLINERLANWFFNSSILTWKAIRHHICSLLPFICLTCVSLHPLLQ